MEEYPIFLAVSMRKLNQTAISTVTEKKLGGLFEDEIGPGLCYLKGSAQRRAASSGLEAKPHRQWWQSAKSYFGADIGRHGFSLTAFSECAASELVAARKQAESDYFQIAVHGAFGEIAKNVQSWVSVYRRSPAYSPLVVFCWPGSHFYPRDRVVAYEAAYPFLRLLEDLKSQDKPADLYQVLAHSAGAQVALTALTHTNYGGGVAELILIAPDIDARTAEQDIATIRNRSKAKRVTAYAASTDSALAAASVLHGGRQRGPPTTASNVLDVIDATTYAGKGNRHNFHVTSDVVQDDIFRALKGYSAPEPPKKRRTASGIYMLE